MKINSDDGFICYFTEEFYFTVGPFCGTILCNLLVCYYIRLELFLSSFIYLQLFLPLQGELLANQHGELLPIKKTFPAFKHWQKYNFIFKFLLNWDSSCMNYYFRILPILFDRNWTYRYQLHSYLNLLWCRARVHGCSSSSRYVVWPSFFRFFLCLS